MVNPKRLKVIRFWWFLTLTFASRHKGSAIPETATQRCTCEFSVSSAGYLSLTHCFSVSSENCTINHTLPKSRFFGIHFFRNIVGLTSTTVTYNWPGIGWNNTKWRPARRSGHWRSPISVPIESPYAISYVSVILTYILSRSVSKLLRILVNFFLSRAGYHPWTHSFSVIAENITVNIILSNTRFYQLHFRSSRYRSNFNHFDITGLTEFGDVTQNDGHYAAQGRKRSISVPTESPYATSYASIIVTRQWTIKTWHFIFDYNFG